MAELKDLPDDESIDAFIRALQDHSKVAKVERADEFVLRVKRDAGDELVVYLTNIYCVGECDVREIQENNNELSAIVTLSAWNLVSADAAQYGHERKLGVFTWKQFFGALNYRKYWLYENMPMGIDDKERRAESKRRARAWN